MPIRFNHLPMTLPPRNRRALSQNFPYQTACTPKGRLFIPDATLSEPPTVLPVPHKLLNKQWSLWRTPPNRLGLSLSALDPSISQFYAHTPPVHRQCQLKGSQPDVTTTY